MTWTKARTAKAFSTKEPPRAGHMLWKLLQAKAAAAVKKPVSLADAVHAAQGQKKAGEVFQPMSKRRSSVLSAKCAFALSSALPRLFRVSIVVWLCSCCVHAL